MKFRPSNGSEGDMFMERNCFQCAQDEGGNGVRGVRCSLIAASMAYDKDDPRYPAEWVAEDVLDPRTWVCTAKVTE